MFAKTRPSTVYLTVVRRLATTAYPLDIMKPFDATRGCLRDALPLRSFGFLCAEFLLSLWIPADTRGNAAWRGSDIAAVVERGLSYSPNGDSATLLPVGEEDIEESDPFGYLLDGF